MKKLLFVLPVIMISFSLHAQDDIVITGTKKINKKLTPHQVIDSLNKHFPNAKSVKYYKAPADAVRNGWTVTEDDNLEPGDQLDYYTISFKDKDLTYYGLYDKEGTLLNSRVTEKLDNLPEPVRNSLKYLSQEHPGYKVTSKSYYRNQNHSKVKEYYEVVAKKGNSKKRLFYSADGKLIKVKG